MHTYQQFFHGHYLWVMCVKFWIAKKAKTNYLLTKMQLKTALPRLYNMKIKIALWCGSWAQYSNWPPSHTLAYQNILHSEAMQNLFDFHYTHTKFLFKMIPNLVDDRLTLPLALLQQTVAISNLCKEGPRSNSPKNYSHRWHWGSIV